MHILIITAFLIASNNKNKISDINICIIIITSSITNKLYVIG